MRRALFVCLATALGLAVGFGAAVLVSAFSPVCGEDCSGRTLAAFAWVMAGAALCFALTSWLLSRRAWPTLLVVVQAWTALGFLFLLPAALYYVQQLHSGYRRLEAIAPVQPTTDFFHMAIATREVQGFMDAGQGSARHIVLIPAWERCLIGAERCDASPRQVEVYCKAGVVNVNETDWPAFVLIPAQNAPGVAPLKSMRLCGG